MHAVAELSLQRCAIRVRGAVQGVGFRPFVYRIACELGLCGFVYNDAEGVFIEAQGEAAVLGELRRRLKDEAPPLSRVEAVELRALPLRDAGEAFTIFESRGGAVKTGIPPDVAACDDCLAELFAPGNRRYRHAFINCTQCGPRYTLTRALPYDRPMTSMAGFVMCPACRAEYEDPTNRRFHAEPNACPVCGPHCVQLMKAWR
jgi:hydrogenase maturation protein HypF